MTKPTVFVQPPWESGAQELFEAYGYPLVTTLEEADIVVFSGGEDIHPQVYKETIIPHAGVDWLDEGRDALEIEAYKRCRPDQFKFGICRGGQLLNVMNGGRLWQDIDRHDRAHDIVDVQTGETIWASSVHHQQFILPTAKGVAEVVATSQIATYKLGHNTRGGIKEWYRGTGETKFNDDPEIVWFPKDRALAIQGHPEYQGYTKFTEYCLQLVERFF